MHVSSSTEGYYVMADPFTGTKADFLSGPHSSEGAAQNAMENLRLRRSATTDGKLDAHKLLGVYNGATFGFRQDMEAAKRLLENNGDALSLSESYSPAHALWQHLDAAICKIDALDALFNEHIGS